VVVTHLSSVITDNAARLLTREDVRVLTDAVRAVNPSAVDELTPTLLSLAEIQRVLQGLLSERVAINDLPRIYEALSLRSKVSTDPEGLIEAVRQALGPALASSHLDATHPDGAVLRVITIDPMLEQEMLEGMRPSEFGTQILINATRIESVLASLKAVVSALEQRGESAVVVCAPSLRPAVRRLLSTQVNGIPVLSYQEATSANSIIETVGVIRASEQIPV